MARRKQPVNPKPTPRLTQSKKVALPDTSFPVGQALTLRLKNHLTWQQIALQLSCPLNGLWKACRPYLKLLENPQSLQAYRDNKIDLLESAEMTLLSSLVEPGALKKAPLAARSMAFGVLYDKGRLEKGLSTQNVTTIHAELGSLQVDREALEQSLASIEAEIAALKGQGGQPQETPALELPGPGEDKAE